MHTTFFSWSDAVHSRDWAYDAHSFHQAYHSFQKANYVLHRAKLICTDPCVIGRRSCRVSGCFPRCALAPPAYLSPQPWEPCSSWVML